MHALTLPLSPGTTRWRRTITARPREYAPKAPENRVAQCKLDPVEACWTSVINPTAEHLDEAKKYQRMAADHRAASQALRDAEARACVGLSDVDHDMSSIPDIVQRGEALARRN